MYLFTLVYCYFTIWTSNMFRIDTLYNFKDSQQFKDKVKMKGQDTSNCKEKQTHITVGCVILPSL